MVIIAARDLKGLDFTPMQRRLTAIVAADVVDYSLLLGLDETATLAALSYLRREIIDPAVSANNGRIFRLTGDGSLFEFNSALNAARFAVAIQLAMQTREVHVAPGKAVIFRIGVDLGDIVVDGDDIHGEGVNVAARLEALSPPGGVLMSHAVYRQIKGPLALQFQPLGERHLKNIAHAVSVWRWMPPQNSGAIELGAAEIRAPHYRGRQILDPKVTDLVIDLHMRSARLGLSDAFDEILALPDEGRSLGMDGIYQRLGAQLNIARNLLSVISVENVEDLSAFGQWQSPLMMSEFISNVFDNAATAYAPRLLPQIQDILRSGDSMVMRRLNFLNLVRAFIGDEMAPQIKRLIKFAFIEN